MAFTRVQGGGIDRSGSINSTASVTLGATVGNGNCICGYVSWDTSTGANLSSVTDDKGNTYNLESAATDTGNNQSMGAFSRTNITNAPQTITATLSVGADSFSVLLDEFSGGSTTSADERDGAAHGGQWQSSPGTAADGVTSGTFTTSVNGDLLWGGTVVPPSTQIASNGTAFSTGTQQTGPFYSGQSEYRTQATAGSGTAATFTQATNNSRLTFLISIKPLSGAAAAPFIPTDVSVLRVQSTPLRSWAWAYNLNLIGQDVLPAGRKGQSYDLSPRGYSPPGKTWTWQYNLSLVGQDVLPPGKQSFERPKPIGWYREWTQNLLLSTLVVSVQRPFNQYNWPLTQRVPQPDRTQVESLVLTTLLGQDAFPPGRQRTERPEPVSWRRDWTQSLILSTLLGQDVLPPGVVSSRVIVPDPWRRDWSQNLLLSTLAPVIQTPLNQYDWPVPARLAVPGPTWTLNLLLSTLAPIGPVPFNQYDWPVPQRVSQPDRSFSRSFNLNLIGQDQLPFRQTEWPVPRGYYYPPSVKDVMGVNPNLFPPPPPPVFTGVLRNPPFIGNSTGQMSTSGVW